MLGIDGPHFDTGLMALRADRVYLEHLPPDQDSETILRQAAREAGNRFGCAFAVSFEVLKR